LAADAARETCCDRLGACLLDREADRSSVRLLITGAKFFLLLLGEHLIEPPLAEATD
jgi:hypothetical protein